MRKTFLAIAAMLLTIGTGMAQEAEQIDKEAECRKNASLFTDYAKQKDYATALEFWESVYRDCPTYTKNTYIYGVKIVEWQFQQATTPEEQAKMFAKLLKVYEDWKQYYGTTDDARANIEAKEAYSYYTLKPKEPQLAYDIFKKALLVQQNSMEAAYIQVFMMLSEQLYHANPTEKAEQYIADYTLCSNILTTNANTEGLKNADKYAQIAEVVNTNFAASGVADCATMNKIFAPAIEQKKNDAEYLNSILKLFKSLRCTDTEAYYAASTHSYNINPTADAANGLGKMWYAKEDYKKCVEYMQKAIELSDGKDIDDIYLVMAMAYNKLGNDAKVRECCKKSLEINPNQGAPYLLLATVYAGANVFGDDPVMSRAKYWAAVDQLKKVAQVESNKTVVETANSMIARYSAMFPTKEQIFMHNELEEGKTLFVGGIVNETTIVRAK